MPTPMMLPMTRLVDWGRLSRGVLAGVASSGVDRELCGHDSSSVLLPMDRRCVPGYGPEARRSRPKVPNEGQRPVGAAALVPAVPGCQRPTTGDHGTACAVAEVGRARHARRARRVRGPARGRHPGPLEPPAGVQLTVLMPAAGLFEGAMLGLAQAVVLPAALGTSAAAPGSWPPASAARWPGSSACCRRPPTTAGRSWPRVWVVAIGGRSGHGAAATHRHGAGTRAAGRHTSYAVAWVGWTALGWCAGLTAFTAVAPPLWQTGQSLWLLIVIGLAGGLAMAVAMAAVTGRGRGASGRRSDADGD